MLALNNVSLSYGETAALHNINISIGLGEICSILGPSGCGKTSILNILAGNIVHYTGEVLLSAAAIDHRQKSIGFISQDYGLLPWRTVYNNIILPLRVKKLDVKSYTDRVDHVLEKLGISNLRNRYPLGLSGGQRQRVAIATAFIMDLDLLLMDEPFSALDQVTKEATQELFFRIWEDTKPTAVFVTHSIEEAVFLGQKIVILSNAPGRTVRIVDNPTFGQKDARVHPEFAGICREIRQTMKSAWEV